MSRVAASLRRAVHERAEGACEYCLVPEALAFAGHEVDHVTAQKHGGATELENLALSCALCNKHKGSDLASIDPETGALTPLYHPRRERWSEHFRIEQGTLLPLTAMARVTVRLLHLNHRDRIIERELLIVAGLIRPPA
ncbi:MAG: HNH endonuclease signature motif containing protein [Byssovorax sp.]